MEQNDKYGRYLVANKNLDCGELIFVDTPFAVGPKPDTPPLCLGCYCPVSNQTCSRCGWPCCGPECEEAPHHQDECGLFSSMKVPFQSPEDSTVSCMQLDCITPLRLLLAKEKDEERWQRDLEPMEAHTEERQERPTWRVDQINIADFLVDHCKLSSRFNKDLVQKVCGILEVNAVEIPSRNGFSIRAIYPRLAITAHNCVPNIVHTILRDYQVQVRAAIPIKAGDQLNLCYTHSLSPTLVRREFLLQSKFFACDCQRCSDPTELGTHLSTLKCSKCDNGVLLPKNSVDNESVWTCTEKNCGFTTTSNAVCKILGLVQSEIDTLDLLEPGATAIEQREALLKKYKTVFHPHHALLLSIKHALAQLYGKVEGYTIDELPDIMLERKTELCRLLLKILDVITPGDSRMRGMMLYELHAPLMFMARNEYAAGVIGSNQLKERLQEPIQCLTDAARILKREDPDSHEGIIGQIAAQSLEQLKLSLDNL